MPYHREQAAWFLYCAHRSLLWSHQENPKQGRRGRLATWSSCSLCHLEPWNSWDLCEWVPPPLSSIAFLSSHQWIPPRIQLVVWLTRHFFVTWTGSDSKVMVIIHRHNITIDESSKASCLLSSSSTMTSSSGLVGLKTSTAFRKLPIVPKTLS